MKRNVRLLPAALALGCGLFASILPAYADGDPIAAPPPTVEPNLVNSGYGW